jgi:D-amino peptidase
MEGVTGLVDAQDVQPHGRDHEWGRLMMTEHVNAAVRGALSAGASSVVVSDAHGPMRNLLPDRLHPAAPLIRGRTKPMGMLEGLDSSFTAHVYWTHMGIPTVNGGSSKRVDLDGIIG